MNKKHEFNVGDSVIVKHGTKDPDTDEDISGWQGRISMVEELESHGVVEIRWDSQTLRNMPRSMIKYCEKEGFDWQAMNLGAEEIEQATARCRARHQKHDQCNSQKHSLALFGHRRRAHSTGARWH